MISIDGFTVHCKHQEPIIKYSHLSPWFDHKGTVQYLTQSTLDLMKELKSYSVVNTVYDSQESYV